MAAQVPCGCCGLAMISSLAKRDLCTQCRKEEDFGDLCYAETSRGAFLTTDENGDALPAGMRARVTRNGRWMFT